MDGHKCQECDFEQIQFGVDRVHGGVQTASGIGGQAGPSNARTARLRRAASDGNPVSERRRPTALHLGLILVPEDGHSRVRLVVVHRVPHHVATHPEGRRLHA